MTRAVQAPAPLASQLQIALINQDGLSTDDNLCHGWNVAILFSFWQDSLLEKQVIAHLLSFAAGCIVGFFLGVAAVCLAAMWALKKAAIG